MREPIPRRAKRTSSSEAKQDLREQVQVLVRALPLAARQTASAQARALLAQQPLWQQATFILFYAPLPDELDVWPLVTHALAEGKQVALPRFVPETNVYTAGAVRDLDRDLASGRFGIREPAKNCAEVPLNRLDFILVPGVAYDPHGRRLGRGRGFYDLLLAAVRGTMCGVAFDEQIVRMVPVGPHDVRLDCILTPTRWIEP